MARNSAYRLKTQRRVGRLYLEVVPQAISERRYSARCGKLSDHRHNQRVAGDRARHIGRTLYLPFPPKMVVGTSTWAHCHARYFNRGKPAANVHPLQCHTGDDLNHSRPC